MKGSESSKGVSLEVIDKKSTLSVCTDLRSRSSREREGRFELKKGKTLLSRFRFPFGLDLADVISMLF